MCAYMCMYISAKTQTSTHTPSYKLNHIFVLTYFSLTYVYTFMNTACTHPSTHQYCPNCFCYVCDVKASQCQGWLRVGHCHAHDKDPYWRALREFTRIEMLSSNPLLPALACDEAAQVHACQDTMKYITYIYQGTIKC